MASVKIAGHEIASRQPCYIIAEAGVNHNGSLETACSLVDAAVLAGANAVKFQTFVAESVMTPYAPKADYQQQTTGSLGSQLDMIRDLQLSFDDFRHIKDYCDRIGITFLSTPFDTESADFLADLGVPAFKIPSGEVVNHPFLEHVARKSRPIIMSTGMSYLSEVDEAVRVIHAAGCNQLVILHCVTGYPATPPEINLRAMITMATAFRVPVGYSDHTLDIHVPIAAVALGAAVIEKHLTLDRHSPGPDHRASLEPEEFQAMVSATRAVESAMGDGLKTPTSSEMKMRSIVRRSLVAATDIASGAILEAPMLTAMRPETGISPALIKAVVGRRATRALRSGHMLTWEDIS